MKKLLMGICLFFIVVFISGCTNNNQIVITEKPKTSLNQNQEPRKSGDLLDDLSDQIKLIFE